MDQLPAHNDPVPDELCPHVELGAEQTGGYVFAAEDPPIAVGMCHQCIEWCRTHFDEIGKMPWSEYVALQTAAGRPIYPVTCPE